MWSSPAGNSSRTTRSTRLWISKSLRLFQEVVTMSSRVARTAMALLTVLTTTAAWAEDKPICPDRPGRGTSACTLDPGRAQIELGLFDDSFQHRSGVTTDTDNIGSVLAKWGVSERADVEAGIALYQEQRVHDASGTTTLGGIGDLFLHAKFNPLSTDGAFALVLD